jgi:transcriptional regulator with XRE-family HTH domain
MKKITKSPERKTARALLAFNARVLRAERDITKEELANLAGIDRGYVGQIEAETRAVSVDIIDRLAQALHVPVARLFAEQGKRSDAHDTAGE